jgi:hypothetical protein
VINQTKTTSISREGSSEGRADTSRSPESSSGPLEIKTAHGHADQADSERQTFTHTSFSGASIYGLTLHQTFHGDISE